MKNCSICGTQFPDDAKFCTTCGASLAASSAAPTASAIPSSVSQSSSQGLNFDFSGNATTATAAKKKYYQYKVLTQKDKWFSGKFDPAMLENALNAYAQQGWRVIGCATADIPGFGTTRQEFITILEREA